MEGDPWLYPYTEDPSSHHYPPGRGQVFRPIVSASVRAPSGKWSQSVWALVDSGSERTLVAPWVAREIGVDPSRDAVREIPLEIGGDKLTVQFVTSMMRLHPPPGREAAAIEWETEIGFVNHWRAPWPMLLGQSGFFDRFTVTMHRHALTVAVEPYERFDQRFGAQIEDAEKQRERFKP